MTLPTGEHIELRTHAASGQVRAVIATVGAGLKELSINGVALLSSYPAESAAPMAAGAVLVPWPNRIRDGNWRRDGQEYQLALTEPARGNAIHGLLRYSEYRITEHNADSVTLEAMIYPQPGYPFLVATAVRYQLQADGIVVQHTLENIGVEAAPMAVGAHPYPKIGDIPTGSLTLTVGASTHFEVDQRLLPIREVPVTGRYDLRSGRPVRDLVLDDGFGGVEHVDGLAEHSLTAPDGRSVAVWADEDFGYVQVFVTPDFPGEDLAVAIEPMTAPADGFNSGKGIRMLEPGARWEPQWGIRFAGFTAD